MRHIRKAAEKGRKGREKERQSDWAIDDVSLWSWGSTPERDNYYTSDNKIDLTQVLRLLNLQDEGEQKCRVIVSHFHTLYVIMPNDYNNSVTILIYGTSPARTALIFLNNVFFAWRYAAKYYTFTWYNCTCLPFVPAYPHADPFPQILSITFYTNYIIEIYERKEGPNLN